MKKIHHLLVNIIKTLIREDDNKNLNIRAGRGYSVGHPYPVKKEPKPVYGYVENQEQVETDNKPVKISKAFKKE